MTGFFCPHCETPDSLEIIDSVAIGATDNFDEVAIQAIECSHCGKRGIALYEESRRGALDGESVAHTGYWLERDAVVHTNLLLSACSGLQAEKSLAELKELYQRKFTGGPIAIPWGAGFPIRRVE